MEIYNNNNNNNTVIIIIMAEMVVFYVDGCLIEERCADDL